MVGTDIPKELVEETYKAIEQAKATGKISKGCNEVTKSIERGTAKLVAIAGDVNPAEIVMHLPGLSKEKGIVCVKVGAKEELGAASGLEVGTACVSITKEGEAKRVIAKIVEQVKQMTGETAKPEKKEEPKEEKAEEKPKKEKKAKPAEKEAPAEEEAKEPEEKAE
ncbi:ribosomal L7Ae/L30e/S12e/Gadd45 family protein [Candidatus Woesearchaeota archaeon]|nr:ribosomal L7Ae/L30e/S12e/Gadd45 family protein [Candidatus Woesearchaeota archaeon]MBW3014623.1 ribosomal L7Ae/L30e/S12e/Gadd45 family protein [Candidatus Woesearchaeota archaeon]